MNVAWVTGASQGIGRALALEMAAHGISVIASARNRQKLDSLVAEANGLSGDIRAYPLDVTDGQAVYSVIDSLHKEFGKIDLAVLNAGTFIPMQGRYFRAGVVKDQMELNVMGVSYCLEKLIPIMVDQGQGVIAINSSLAGYRGLSGSAAYGASKAALINMAESLHLDLMGTGVDVKIINPGFVKTPLTDKNQFPMPFLMDVDRAAKVIYKGLVRKAFEIRFPFIFGSIMGLLRYFPYWLYFHLLRSLRMK